MGDVLDGQVAIEAARTAAIAADARHEGHVPASPGHRAGRLAVGVCPALGEAPGDSQQAEAMSC